MKLSLFGIFCFVFGFSNMTFANEPLLLSPQRYVPLPNVLATPVEFSPDLHRVNYGVTDAKYFTFFSRDLDTGKEVHLKLTYGSNGNFLDFGSEHILGNRAFSPNSKILGWSFVRKSSTRTDPEYSYVTSCFEFYDAASLRKLWEATCLDPDRPNSPPGLGYPWNIYFSPDSRKAILSSPSIASILVIDMKDGRVTKLESADKIWADNINVAFSQSTSRAVVARDGRVEAFDLASGKKLWGYFNLGNPNTYSTNVEYFDSEQRILLTFGSFQSPWKQARFVLSAKDGSELESVSSSELGRGGFKKDGKTYHFLTNGDLNREGAFITNAYDLSSRPATFLNRQIFGGNLEQCLDKEGATCSIDFFSPVFSERTNILVANIMKYPTHFPAVFDLESGEARYRLDVQGKDYIESVNSRWNVFTLSNDGGRLALKVQTNAENGFFLFKLH